MLIKHVFLGYLIELEYLTEVVKMKTQNLLLYLIYEEFVQLG